MQIYLVGGAVRDELLGLKVSERDWVVVGATAEQMLAQHFIPVGKFFPVFLHPRTKEEYALARTERKTSGGYHGFIFNTDPKVTLEEDLARRDLTINAMAKTPEGKIIDPFGGQRDLMEKRLRHVSQAFIEDPVRVLRVARFAARLAPLGFQVAPETRRLMQQMNQTGELNYLVAERVCKEMLRALKEACPSAFLQTLRACNALATILPEIEALYDASFPPLIEQVLAKASELSEEASVRFASLFAAGCKNDANKRSVQALCQRLRIPKALQSLALLVVENYPLCCQLTPQPEKLLNLLEAGDAFRRPQRYVLFLLACEAHFNVRYQKEFIQKEWLLHALKQAQSIKPPLLANGESIKAALYQARLKAITIDDESDRD